MSFAWVHAGQLVDVYIGSGNVSVRVDLMMMLRIRVLPGYGIRAECGPHGVESSNGWPDRADKHHVIRHQRKSDRHVLLPERLSKASRYGQNV